MLALPLTAAMLLHATPTQMDAHGDVDRALRALLAAFGVWLESLCASCRSTSLARQSFALGGGHVPLPGGWAG